ncbi:Ada metal-binding domain-containing protein [Yinghuangia seranimata]|uniref:Ada metal-binding domain-containing protein n=1 Tax=Yinghuangia seranimata TaxID=408067 RepID=UPI00248C0F7F|nr:Ada metal-binding domain-containing protein [Yinghuangia seranimata]MDI2126548.1 Ada metal-binding domain-containing protein [Yinghuangia seranimata]
MTGAGRYTLIGPDGHAYRSSTPGTVGGYRRGRLYGRLDCPSALRAIAAGGYVAQRVFFADEATARAAGYRPCARCMPGEYADWKAGRMEWAGADGTRGPRSSGTKPVGGRAGLAAPVSGAHPTVLGGAVAASPLVPGALATQARGPDRGIGGPSPGELATVLRLLSPKPGVGPTPRTRVRTVSVGHARDPRSRASAEAFVDAWTSPDRSVLAVVDWPEDAASWLKAARRLTEPEPDAWVIAAGPLGWAQLARRLRHSTAWRPTDTVGFAPVGTLETVELAGPGTLAGMRGATEDGGVWRIGHELIAYDA